MTTVEIYRDDVCRLCDAYVEKMAKWSNEYGFKIKVLYVETDISAIIDAMLKSREEGAKIDVLPFTIIQSKNEREIFDGMLDTEEEVKEKLKKHICNETK